MAIPSSFRFIILIDIAVAANVLLERYSPSIRRILIIDLDVHQGTLTCSWLPWYDTQFIRWSTVDACYTVHAVQETVMRHSLMETIESRHFPCTAVGITSRRRKSPTWMWNCQSDATTRLTCQPWDIGLNGSSGIDSMRVLMRTDFTRTMEIKGTSTLFFFNLGWIYTGTTDWVDWTSPRMEFPSAMPWFSTSLIECIVH